jgi:holliday junction DNA helicase RuvA
MIGRLTGNVVHQDADGTVVLDVGGVGYEMMVPAGTVPQSGPDDSVTLWVHTHVREDALTLFGFASLYDRSVFRALIGISNVGPRTALSLLSAISTADLSRAIQTRDTAMLVKIPGVGKKTAERLVLELRDKLPAPAGPVASGPAPGGGPAPLAGPRSALVVQALARLGFKPAEAERAVASLGELVETDSLDKSIRDALTVLRR